MDPLTTLAATTSAVSSSALLNLAWIAAAAALAALSGAACYRVGLEAARDVARDEAEAIVRPEAYEEGRSEGEALGYERGHTDGKRVGRAAVLTKIQGTVELLAIAGERTTEP